jgi:hypothetical protein
MKIADEDDNYEGFQAVGALAMVVMESAGIREYIDSENHGHDCNCTVLFCLAKELGLLKGGILGRGIILSLYWQSQ